MVKNLPAMQETWLQSLGLEDPLEKGMATHSSILAWRIPWTEEPGRLQSMGSQRVGHDWVTSLSLSYPLQAIIANILAFILSECQSIYKVYILFVFPWAKQFVRFNLKQELNLGPQQWKHSHHHQEITKEFPIYSFQQGDHRRSIYLCTHPSTLLHIYCSFSCNFSVDNWHPFMSGYSWINKKHSIVCFNPHVKTFRCSIFHYE